MVDKKTSVKKEIKKEISKELSTKDKKDLNKLKCTMKMCAGGKETGGCFYFLGFIGALIYFITTAPSVWDAVLGFFKAIVWPAFLVYGLFLFMGA